MKCLCRISVQGLYDYSWGDLGSRVTGRGGGVKQYTACGPCLRMISDTPEESPGPSNDGDDYFSLTEELEPPPAVPIASTTTSRAMPLNLKLATTSIFHMGT